MPTAVAEKGTSLVGLQHQGTSLVNVIKPLKLRDKNHEYITLFCTQCGYEYVVMLNCGDRTCCLCRKKWYGYHYKVLKTLVKAWGDQIRVMELTIKNISDDRFKKGHIKMIRRYFGRLLHRKYYKSRIKGGFYFVHLTNIGQGWHLHLHIIFKGGYIPQAKLSKDWKTITKGSYIVWIRRNIGVNRAISYLLSDLLQKPKILDQYKEKYNNLLKGSRLVQGFGEYSKVGFRKDFICPVCQNNSWYCPDFEKDWQDNEGFNTS